MLKEKDFIELDYTGRIKETNQVFDTTEESIAKKENVYNPNASYGPKVICLGQKQILPAIDKEIIGKKVNETIILNLSPDEAFGKKDMSLIKTVNTNDLLKKKINPFPGLQINASGLLGTIRSVNGGRTTIDFNHPFAGKNLVYEIKINKIITEKKEQLDSLLIGLLGLQKKDYTLKMENNKAEITIKQEFPEKLKEEFKLKAQELIPNIEISI